MFQPFPRCTLGRVWNVLVVLIARKDSASEPFCFRLRVAEIPSGWMEMNQWQRPALLTQKEG